GVEGVRAPGDDPVASGQLASAVAARRRVHYGVGDLLQQRGCARPDVDAEAQGPGWPPAVGTVVEQRDGPVGQRAYIVLAPEVGRAVAENREARSRGCAAELPVDVTSRLVDGIDGIRMTH